MPFTEFLPYTVHYTKSFRYWNSNPTKKAFPIFSKKMKMKQMESREFK